MDTVNLRGHATSNEVLQSRGWKLFFLLPRMLLSRHPRGGFISRERLTERFTRFSGGEWGFVDPCTGVRRSGCHSFQKETEEATAKRPRAPDCPGPRIG